MNLFMILFLNSIFLSYFNYSYVIILKFYLNGKSISYFHETVFYCFFSNEYQINKIELLKTHFKKLKKNDHSI